MRKFISKWMMLNGLVDGVTNMKVSGKRLKEITSRWNPEMVVYVRYTTPNSKGKMTFSIAFFLEYWKKIQRLFKGCEIREIFVKNEITGIVYETFQTFPELWFYAIGR